MDCTCKDPKNTSTVIEIYAPTKQGQPNNRLWWGRNSCPVHKMYEEVIVPEKPADET